MRQVLQEVAALITALTVILGGLWWLVGPRIRGFLRKQQAAAEQLQRNGGSTVADQVHQSSRDLSELRGIALGNREAITEVKQRLVTHRDANKLQAVELRAWVEAALHANGLLPPSDPGAHTHPRPPSRED